MNINIDINIDTDTDTDVDRLEIRYQTVDIRYLFNLIFCTLEYNVAITQQTLRL